MQERLQKVLARAGFASRRGAEQLMLEGRVTVNGEIVRELGAKADVEADDVRVDGVRVKAPRALVYLVLNKPRGALTTRSDPENRPTVMSLVPAVAGLFPVGRLDVTTEGLILLTNDGGFAERVSHPRYEVPRVYHAKVTGVPDDHALERLRRGVRVDQDLMAVDRVRVLEADNNAWVEVTLHEGKQHEVRRLLEAVGHPVSKLRRVAFGPVTTKGLEPGQFRSLTPEEIEGLRKGIGARVSPARIATRRGPKPKPSPDRRGSRRFVEGERRGPRGFEGDRRRPPQRFVRDERQTSEEGAGRFDRRAGRTADGGRAADDARRPPSEERGPRRFQARGPRRFEGDRGDRPFDRRRTSTFDKRGTSTFDKRGTSTFVKRSTSTFEKRGTGSFDKRGTGSFDKRSTGTFEKRGSGTFDKRGGGSVGRRGTGSSAARRGGKPPAGPRRGGRR